MIYSMTAFAHLEIKQEWGNAVWEMRSVNQRFLETYFRLPETFRHLEMPLRERLRAALTRGKVECHLRIELNQHQTDGISLNQEYSQQVISSLKCLKQMANEGEINLVDVLRFPGVIEHGNPDLDQINQDLLAGFEQLLNEFIVMRGREGLNLQKLIEQRLKSISAEAGKVQQQMPAILQWQKDRLQQRFQELSLPLDPQRIEQEMVLLAQRVDVAEELDRLQLHVKETLSILQKGGAVGRKLDFMMQELNREANTLASKSINAEVTNSAVELKVLIEQIREQIQNLE
ncbi:uncharacterized protein (TIGR00255 family) [Nicoletella semolina]|uniref:Uncharacterized protein (TIGR00255 family) n=1 Tax=Nicoletella semolina TaxID=271160 RepID=A0A4R2N614_9PAST|nr:YicC/YloC family endoribonuclease [Nicoletella semolina]MDH2925153.1 hypothetical protein [Nicoletella semolina]TCP16251.1 uncharacterized protein (TIGR00255 family) [Nicoletella semolina]